MIAYQTGIDGVYVGPVVCDESPLEPGVFLIPAGAVQIEPPHVNDFEYARWHNGSWIVEAIRVPEPFVEVDPLPTWESVRAARDRLLAASDWTQVADAPVDSSAWAVYRQALRDIPQDFATPDAVVWPTPPV